LKSDYSCLTRLVVILYVYDFARVRVSRCRSLRPWNLGILGMWLASPENGLGIVNRLDFLFRQDISIDGGGFE
jgi:hypothetical protein